LAEVSECEAPTDLAYVTIHTYIHTYRIKRGCVHIHIGQTLQEQTLREIEKECNVQKERKKDYIRLLTRELLACRHDDSFPNPPCFLQLQ
jgi:hypothetical protein